MRDRRATGRPAAAGAATGSGATATDGAKAAVPDAAESGEDPSAGGRLAGAVGSVGGVVLAGVVVWNSGLCFVC